MTSVDLSDYYAEQMVAGPRCPIALTLAQMSADEAARLNSALASHDLDGTAIARRLRKLGYTVRAQSIQRHRRGVCHCEP